MNHRPVQRRALSVALFLLTPTVAFLLLTPTVALLVLTPTVAPAPPSGVQEALAQSLVDQNALAELETTSSPPAPGKAAARAPEEPTAEPTQEPEPTPEPTQEPAPEPEPTEDDPELFVTPPRSLYLAVGHGRRADGSLDTGTIHPRTGQREIDAGAVVVQAMTEVLEQAPNLTLWAQSGNHPDVVGTVRAANHRRADDCIEIHQDWSRAPPGAFAHWHPSSGGAKQLADKLVVSLGGEGIPIRNNWHKARPGLWFLRGTTCRAVLVEVGRVGDFDSEQLAAYGRAMAHAYLDDLRSHPGQGSPGTQHQDGEDRGAKNRKDGSNERGRQDVGRP